MEKFCIFCGQTPKEKTKEHVLPQWLIEVTGNPKRVVKFGYNIVTGQQPKFDWASFVFPACNECNSRYSDLENCVKAVTERLLNDSHIKVSECLVLLDWLDKLRIGLWLGYLYLHNNIIGIRPKFYINSRIGQKDRSLAIYVFNERSKGLNVFGAETPIFQVNPSCFSIRINHILLFSVSWDFMCSLGCGFPFPRNKVINLDKGGVMECSDFIVTRKVKHPILDDPIIKPVVHIFQPIFQDSIEGDEREIDKWVENRLIPGTRQGYLVRQNPMNVELLDNFEAMVKFNEVSGSDCKPIKDIVAQTYDWQLKGMQGIEHCATDKNVLQDLRASLKAYKKLNVKLSERWRNLSKRI